MPVVVPARSRRRAPTPADLLVVLALAAWIPVQLAARPRAHAPQELHIQSDAGSRRVDARVDGDYEIPGPAGVTLLRVRGGEAWIAAAPCRNHLCQRMGRLGRRGASLVCIPNRVVVAHAAGASGVDAVTR